MSRHDDTVRLHHMLDHAREAVQMASGRTRPDLDSDRQFALAITRLLEILGEAAAAGGQGELRAEDRQGPRVDQ